MLKSAIKVYARIKPIIDNNAVKHSYKIQHDYGNNGKEYLIINSTPDGYENKQYSFKFTKVFPEQSDQCEFYDIVGKPVVERLLIGYNGAIFAFGQTGTGKTHSIIGGLHDASSAGIIPRVFGDIFNFINTNPGSEWTLFVSTLEIYNEVCYDLMNLVESNNQEDEDYNFRRVYIMEDGDGTIKTKNLAKHKVQNMGDVMKYLSISMNNRVVADTPMNQLSSRSHFIFTLYVIQEIKNDGIHMESKLHLVDLAGSERAKKRRGFVVLFNEAKYINLSLHYLQQVIVALNDPKRNHVPYRNSLLTSLLRDSLGGNCNTVMVFTISLETQNLEETITTCKFAQRVSLIKNEPRVIVEYDANKQLSLLKKKANRLSSLMLSKNESSIVKEKKSICEKSAQCHTKMNSNEKDIHLIKNSEYLKQTVRHINRGIELLSKLLREIPSLRIIHENAEKSEQFCQKFTNVLGLDLPENNSFTGDLYNEEQRMAYKEFVKLAGTSEALMRYLELNILYYRELETEWRLWDHERTLMEKISELEHKRSVALKFGEFPDVVQNLSKNYNICVQKYHRIRHREKTVQESRRNRMKMFTEARKKFLGAFEIWWQRQKSNRFKETEEKGMKTVSCESYYPLCRNTLPANHSSTFLSDITFAHNMIESAKESPECLSSLSLKVKATHDSPVDTKNNATSRNNSPITKSSPLLHKIHPIHSSLDSKLYAPVNANSLLNNEEPYRDTIKIISPERKLKTNGTIFHSLFSNEDKGNNEDSIGSAINLKLTGDADLDSRILSFYRQYHLSSIM